MKASQSIHFNDQRTICKKICNKISIITCFVILLTSKKRRIVQPPLASIKHKTKQIEDKTRIRVAILGDPIKPSSHLPESSLTAVILISLGPQSLWSTNCPIDLNAVAFATLHRRQIMLNFFPIGHLFSRLFLSNLQVLFVLHVIFAVFYVLCGVFYESILFYSLRPFVHLTLGLLLFPLFYVQTEGLKICIRWEKHNLEYCILR